MVDAPDVHSPAPRAERMEAGLEKMLGTHGYTSIQLLLRKKYAAIYRGRRLADGASVLLKCYGSRLRYLRSRTFLTRLSGTGAPLLGFPAVD